MMPWIQTHTGRQFWPLSPRPEDICIDDIAHALARQCRFSGHTTSFYSVAEHSIRVARIVPSEDRLWALLHDASEAYLVDLPSPLKRHPSFAAYREAEVRLMRVICERFGLPTEEPPSVRLADAVLLATEKRDLLGPDAAPWGQMAPPLPAPIRPWAVEDAEGLFMATFFELEACHG